MVFDLVHLSDPSFWDALDHYALPPIVSHSNARAICSHRRNLTDEQIREIGKRGGVIGLNFLSMFIDNDLRLATPDRLADHAVHIASLAGAGALALGPDYADYYMEAMERWLRRDQLPADLMTFVPGAESVRTLPVLVQALADRGFTDSELAGILGGNALRVYSTILPNND
jgi:membrane dipeptidase